MKPGKIISSILIYSILLISCKKSNDDDSIINWKEELNGSVWAGQYRLTTGIYVGYQPFSMILNNDGTLSWYQTTTSSPATWVVENNTIKIKFPDDRTFSADLSKDSWGNFKNITDNKFRVESVFRSSIPKVESLEKTTWKGTFYAVPFTIRFFSPQKSDITLGGAGIHKIQTFTVFGAGILTRGLPDVQAETYFVFRDSVNISGYTIQHVNTDVTDQVSWEAKKQ